MSIIDWFLIRVKSSFYYPNLPIIPQTKNPATWRGSCLNPLGGG